MPTKEKTEEEGAMATRKYGIVVNKKQDFIKALNDFKPDVVLSDHSLPQFDSIEAMHLWKAYEKKNNLSIPFILITGSVSEEFAVQTIKAGLMITS